MIIFFHSLSCSYVFILKKMLKKNVHMFSSKYMCKYKKLFIFVKYNINMFDFDVIHLIICRINNTMIVTILMKSTYIDNPLSIFLYLSL